MPIFHFAVFMQPGRLFLLAWLAWAVTWFVAAIWSAKTERRATFRSEWRYRAAMIAGALLLFHRTSDLLGFGKLWHVGLVGAYALLGVTVVGFAFAWWARVHLGRLWSGSVTRKEGHRVVDSGPYGIVRHPIYTGLLLSTYATAAALATLPAIVGAGLLTFGIWLKARLEERFLTDELGAEAYGGYRSRVPMLLPFGPTSSRG